MLRALITPLLLIGLSSVAPAYAEHYRVADDSAVLYTTYQSLADASMGISSGSELDRLQKDSFPSLTAERISENAVKVTLRRRDNRLSIRSRGFLRSRNTCNALVVKRLLRTSRNLGCEPNWEVTTTLTPSDPQYPNMYALGSTSAGRIHAPEAWEISTGSANVVVGIIDTGIDYNHIDLQANVWNNPGEIGANEVDDDANGKIDDLHGIDTWNGDSDPNDDQSHGTHVAGTIGAVGNNSLGVVGINWNVKLLACKAFNSSGTGSITSILGCINYLVSLKNSHGVNIQAINNSYGGFPFSNAMLNAIAAVRDAGIVFVAGAGNNSSNNESTPFYPASYQLANVISVAANESQGAKASFSNYGATSVDIAAPGVSILSTIPGDQYAYFQGTSMATPHVTGAIALIRANRPDLTYAQAISSVLNTGTVAPAFAGLSVTGAILNLENALMYDPPATTPPSPGGDGPDISSSRLEISASPSRPRTTVSCRLTALQSSEYVPLSGYRISLVIRGVAATRRQLSDSDGYARFIVRTPIGRSLSARCAASLSDPDTNEIIRVKSSSVTLPSSGR